ncbi:MAG: hypothetical protein HY985_11935 [Magnetospirillum sp.]|nr:hypothetical protein [Magnetospirillum sp.]
MRFVVAESFDKNEINRFFEADIPPRIGERLRTTNGRLYRITDVGWQADPFDGSPAIRVYLQRLQ